jgi:malic enzyme
MHRGGKISVRPTVDVADRAALAMAYTPDVARVCTAIAERHRDRDAGCAARRRAARVAGKEFGQLRAVVAGAGVAVTKMLLRANQINNSLAFPGVFRGALATRATGITDGMKLAAADAMAAQARADGVARR